ncbi:MAG: molybdopterin-dependent oxidoreductase [Hyphomicrobiales bacterium]|nr:molybdopterin-dependent oxidoreductase [Hyphomicrobiales bacterium]
MTLPVGQFDIGEMPRFGLTRFADRFPDEVKKIQLGIGGDVEHLVEVADELSNLPRVKQISDFHCVTTWSCRGLEWEGILFKDLYANIVLPLARPRPEASFVVFRCQDGYRSSLQLSDLLADNVMLADRLNGEALSISNGAPLRLVAPAHYGYKSPKHLNRIEFRLTDKNYRPAGLRFMEHPRARVEMEERGIGIPGWLLRHVYRRSVGSNRKLFKRALEQHLADTKRR